MLPFCRRSRHLVCGDSVPPDYALRGRGVRWRSLALQFDVFLAIVVQDHDGIIDPITTTTIRSFVRTTQDLEILSAFPGGKCFLRCFKCSPVPHGQFNQYHWYLRPRWRLRRRPCIRPRLTPSRAGILRGSHSRHNAVRLHSHWLCGASDPTTRK